MSKTKKIVINEKNGKFQYPIVIGNNTISQIIHFKKGLKLSTCGMLAMGSLHLPFIPAIILSFDWLKTNILVALFILK